MEGGRCRSGVRLHLRWPYTDGGRDSSGEGGGGAVSSCCTIRRERLLRGLDADSLNALVMSSVEKESLRGSGVLEAVGKGIVSVIVGLAAGWGGGLMRFAVVPTGVRVSALGRDGRVLGPHSVDAGGCRGGQGGRGGRVKALGSEMDAYVSSRRDALTQMCPICTVGK
jgi:hypothetical protein